VSTAGRVARGRSHGRWVSEGHHERVCREGLDEVLNEQVVLNQSESETVQVDDRHSIGMCPALVRRPALGNRDEVLYRSFAVQHHALERVDDLAEPPVDTGAYCVEQNC
jgi:hypothetical protein